MLSKEQASAIWLYLDLKFSGMLPEIIEEAGYELHHSRYKNGEPLFVLSKIEMA
jgi:hypothetical protein